MENNEEEEKILSMKIFRGLIFCCYLFWSFVLAAALCNQVEKVFHNPLHFPSAHASVTVSVKNPEKNVNTILCKRKHSLEELFCQLPIWLKDHEEYFCFILLVHQEANWSKFQIWTTTNTKPKKILKVYLCDVFEQFLNFFLNVANSYTNTDLI